MVIHYNEIDDNSKLVVADILSKRESIDGTLADIQTERATAELGWKVKEQELNAEKNKLTQDIRNIRVATVELKKV